MSANFPEKTGQKIPEQKGGGAVPFEAIAFNVWQHQLAHQLGITEDELRERRNKFLTEGEHYKKRGNKMFFSAAGIARLRETLCVPSPDSVNKNNVASGEASTRKTLSREVTLKVWRTAPHIVNVHIIEAHFPEKDPNDRRNIVRVRVTNNANFIPGMELPARLIQSPDYYECTRPAPRTRGRW